ncbi:MULTISPECIES: glycine cleavage system protein GcvH [Amphritea]|jgi:glycine cleavage system H protein|uniref:Glycine cleavage system H protein n=2 Tax=Amphritea TaxID=515417 RepID=A0A1H9K2X1_9GAMM|nr:MULTISPECIES: glycine cleavage system protein GcvH [Amphritea]MBN0988068.1 glycine cleavage system protein GcvH [Amphritea pacifica]MBN1006713.1 glycine cleavage system protein GcvH [Amphritea pacifica]SEQ93440.1 glycine cleavage system H protein [Amphritea atlantica]
MSDIPSDLKYVASHEWIRDEGDGVVTIGITDHAQDLLGDVVFVELPEVGAEFATGDDLGVVESVKAASDVYAPLSGEVIAINEELEDAPELVNSDPYGDGWFVQIRLSDESETDDLLDADGYAELCEAES